MRDSGKKSLKDVRSVVRNPEIASLSDVLLSALTEPAKFTKAAIEALLVCEFIHSIDAPSLALLVPVLQVSLCFFGAGDAVMLDRLLIRLSNY